MRFNRICLEQSFYRRRGRAAQFKAAWSIQSTTLSKLEEGTGKRILVRAMSVFPGSFVETNGWGIGRIPLD